MTERTTQRRDGVPLSTRVVTAVASAADVDPVDVPPLNDVVDPDALNSLCSPREDGAPRRGASVSFVLCDHHVFVDADGSVDVSPMGIPNRQLTAATADGHVADD